MVSFDIIEGVSVDTEEEWTIEQKREAKAIALNDTLINMKYRMGEYEKATADEILTDLIDIILSGIDF